MSITGRDVYIKKIGSAMVPITAPSGQVADQWCYWLRTALCKICYPILDMADTERADMMEKLKKSPVYKQNLKRLANMACKHLHDITEGCLVDCDAEPMHDFAAYVSDGIRQDVEHIRNGMSKYLNQRNVPYASIIARMETVNVLLQIEVKCYDKVCEIMRDKTGGGNLSEIYGYMRAGKVLREWDNLANELARINPYDGPALDLNKSKEAYDAVISLWNHAFEGDLIDNSLNQMHDEYQK